MTLGVEHARRAVEEADMRLAREDQIRFVEARFDPPSANAGLTRAAKAHARFIAPR